MHPQLYHQRKLSKLCRRDFSSLQDALQVAEDREIVDTSKANYLRGVNQAANVAKHEGFFRSRIEPAEEDFKCSRRWQERRFSDKKIAGAQLVRDLSETRVSELFRNNPLASILVATRSADNMLSAETQLPHWFYAKSWKGSWACRMHITRHFNPPSGPSSHAHSVEDTTPSSFLRIKSPRHPRMPQIEQATLVLIQS